MKPALISSCRSIIKLSASAPKTFANQSSVSRPRCDARSVARRLCALRFIETFDDSISLQPGEPIDPKDSIELIDLVLETYGEQTIGLFDLFHSSNPGSACAQGHGVRSLPL